MSRKYREASLSRGREDSERKCYGAIHYLHVSPIRQAFDADEAAQQMVASILPVCQVNVEVGSFDTQKMQHPDIAGLQYQQGELQGYLMREYLLEKWGRQCAYCKGKGVPLEIEHITPRSKGGSNRASNLTLACHACNTHKGAQTAAEFGHPKIQAQASVPLRDAAHVSALKTTVVKQLETIFGKEHVVSHAVRMGGSQPRWN
jgi:5-methylcytosine-specific restriction endonuclease McrA